MNPRIIKLKNNKSLIESFFSLSILNGLNVLLPLITLPYILRIVGAANYGIYAYVYVLIQYILLLNAYGFNYSATKQIAGNREDKNQLNIIYNSVVGCRILLLFAGLIIISLLSPFLLDTATKQWMFIMGLGVVLGDTFNPVWLFQGMEKMRYMTIVNIVSKSIFTVLIFVFIRKADDYPYILLINSLGFLSAGLISTVIAKKQFGISFFVPKLNDVKFQFREGMALFGTSIGTNLYRNANVFILSFFVTESALGIYAAVEKIIKGLQMITVPVAQALFPHLGNKFKKQPLTQNLSLLFRVSKVYASVLVLELIVTFLAAPWLVDIICGKGFTEAVPILRVMSFVVLFGGLNYILGMVGLVNLNRQKDFFIAVMISGVISVLFLISTVSFWEIKSAALALVISELVLLVILILHVVSLHKQTVKKPLVDRA